MNKYFKFFLGAVVLAVSTLGVASCYDTEDTEPVQLHHGGSGK